MMTAKEAIANKPEGAIYYRPALNRYYKLSKEGIPHRYDPMEMRWYRVYRSWDNITSGCAICVDLEYLMDKYLAEAV